MRKRKEPVAASNIPNVVDVQALREARAPPTRATENGLLPALCLGLASFAVYYMTLYPSTGGEFISFRI